MAVLQVTHSRRTMQARHFKVSRGQSLYLTSSGSWLSSGVKSSASLSVLAAEPMDAYLLGSRPRHSASIPASMPSIGAQRRSIGGKSCLARYQSTSGLSVPPDFCTSIGEYARLAAISFEPVSFASSAVVVVVLISWLGLSLSSIFRVVFLVHRRTRSGDHMPLIL